MKTAKLTNGYVLTQISGHPNGMSMGHNGKGWIYEHRHVVEQHLGRLLSSEEHVHHVNGVKSDNRLENLEVLSPSEHQRKHIEISGSFQTSFKCSHCGTEVVIFSKSLLSRQSKSASGLLYCSKVCSNTVQRKVVRPTKETLQQEIEEMTWVALGKKYGVSDNSVRNWARSYGLL